MIVIIILSVLGGLLLCYILKTDIHSVNTLKYEITPVIDENRNFEVFIFDKDIKPQTFLINEFYLSILEFHPMLNIKYVTSPIHKIGRITDVLLEGNSIINEPFKDF